MRRWLLTTIAGAVAGAISAYGVAQGPLGPLATRIGFADTNGALKATAIGDCGTLGPAGPLESRIVRVDSNGALQVCGVSGGAGTGDIDSVTAGTGLTGGGTSGAVTLNVAAGTYLDVAADDVSLDLTEILGSVTFGDGSTDTIVWTFNRATGTDPTITFNDGAIALQSLTLSTVLAEASGGTGQATFLAALNAITGVIDHGGVTSFELPNGAAPTVDALGELAADSNLWDTGRGAVLAYDGTAATALIGALVSDTPSNGQVPKWNTGGTITWEADNSGGAITCADTRVIFADGADTPACDAGITYNKTTDSLTLVGAVTVADEAYDDAGWNGDLTVPTKNALRDILETFLTFTDPDADRFVFWDDSAGSIVALTLPAAFSISDTTASLTLPYTLQFTAGVCQNATASVGLSTPSTLGATAGCHTVAAASGDPAYGYAVFASGGDDTELHGSFELGSDWTGAIDVTFKWNSNSTASGDVVWEIQTGCVAAGEAGTAISFNANAFAADANNTGAVLQFNTATKTSLDTTGCAAGETLFFIIHRDTDTAGDTLDQDVRLVSATFTLRRSIS